MDSDTAATWLIIGGLVEIAVLVTFFFMASQVAQIKKAVVPDPFRYRHKRECPWCMSYVDPRAQVCKECGRDLEPWTYFSNAWWRKDAERGWLYRADTGEFREPSAAVPTPERQSRRGSFRSRLELDVLLGGTGRYAQRPAHCSRARRSEGRRILLRRSQRRSKNLGVAETERQSRLVGSAGLTRPPTQRDNPGESEGSTRYSPSGSPRLPSTKRSLSSTGRLGPWT